MVSFINERVRGYLTSEYSAAGDYKAFALSIGGFTGAALDQPNVEAARNMALEQRQKRADAAQSPRRCELYAVDSAGALLADPAMIARFRRFIPTCQSFHNHHCASHPQ
ncbi:hypothetical protein AC629_17230 [Bradyrhizobium sp. NAS80.1]|uniref:hypothetical protein n=1 Tax=Bradyrhizobium sp. NAS80.1 TaxID=1680159 RepID=UPI0009661642|nr:hypothetical protein [Bradyrhizobium sp. NAS80.1]OKO86224.1 hypothetical protein AC629_17230 [Bradyrhizobium sp. NAS80.1]